MRWASRALLVRLYTVLACFGWGRQLRLGKDCHSMNALPLVICCRPRQQGCIPALFGQCLPRHACLDTRYQDPMLACLLGAPHGELLLCWDILFLSCSVLPLKSACHLPSHRGSIFFDLAQQWCIAPVLSTIFLCCSCACLVDRGSWGLCFASTGDSGHCMIGKSCFAL